MHLSIYLYITEYPVLHTAVVVEELGGREDYCAHDGPRRGGRVRGKYLYIYVSIH